MTIAPSGTDHKATTTETISYKRRNLRTLNQDYERYIAATDDVEKNRLLTILIKKLVRFAAGLTYKILTHKDDDFCYDLAHRLVMNLDTFRGDCKFTTWAATMFINAARDQRKSDQRMISFSNADNFDQLFGADPRASDPLEKIIIDEYIEDLSDGESEIASLYREGYTRHEVADMLHVTEKTIQRKRNFV